MKNNCSFLNLQKMICLHINVIITFILGLFLKLISAKLYEELILAEMF